MSETLTRPLLYKTMERAAQHLVPFQVTLELTYRCNLSCKHCYVDVPSRDELSFSEMKGILDQLARAGTLYLLLTGGEILVRHDFLAIARLARTLGFQLILLTNGTLMTPMMAEEIAKLKPLLVGVSLHGATPDTHDLITGRPGSFEATLRGTDLLRCSGVNVALHTVLMDSNERETAMMK